MHFSTYFFSFQVSFQFLKGVNQNRLQYLVSSLHTKVFPVFKHDEAIPVKQNNETKRCTFEIWFAHKEIVNGEDDGNDEDIDFVSYFRIVSLKVVTFVSRHNVHILKSAGKHPYADFHI